MGRNKKQKTEDAIVLENGKWKTPDGLCYNTMDKALKHVHAMSMLQEEEKVITKNNNDGKDE